MHDEQIRDYRMRIEDLHNEIEQIKRRMEQCDEALYEIGKMQSAYEESCYIQQQRARELKGNYLRVRYTKRFENCIGQIMDGEKQHKLREAFEMERDNIRRKEFRLEDDIKERYRQIDELEYQIEEIERQREIESMPLY